MAWILTLPWITFIFVALVENQIVVEGRRPSNNTRHYVHHKAHQKKVKQKTDHKNDYKFTPTPQEPHYEAPVKKSAMTATIRKVLGNNLIYVKTRSSYADKASEKRIIKEKRTKIKQNKKDSGGLDLSDDLLAGSVKQSSAIENALSLHGADAAAFAFHEIPRPVEEKAKRTSPKRATKSTIEILSEKTNPEGGMEGTARFRSEAEDKMADTTFDENEEETFKTGEESVFRRTMPKMIKEKESLGVKEKRSYQDESPFEQPNDLENEFYDGEDTSAKSYGMEDAYGGWDTPGKGKHVKNPADETMMLKNLLHQDTVAFGTLQEAKDEQNTIKQIENISKQSSILPKNLHLPYMPGSMNDLGLDFSKMDISVGKLDSSPETSDFNENEKGGKAIFLKRHSVPATGAGHAWETRNRNKIPRHHIDSPNEQSDEFENFPVYARFPAFHRSPQIRPIQLEEFLHTGRFPPIAPAIITREEKAPREPVPQPEAEPEDEPPPVSEFIQADEPAPIPELPSLREIPPIPEIREPEPKNLNPKDTFGS